jgi:hypothetical protein
VIQLKEWSFLNQLFQAVDPNTGNWNVHGSIFAHYIQAFIFVFRPSNWNLHLTVHPVNQMRHMQ